MPVKISPEVFLKRNWTSLRKMLKIFVQRDQRVFKRAGVELYLFKA